MAEKSRGSSGRVGCVEGYRSPHCRWSLGVFREICLNFQVNAGCLIVKNCLWPKTETEGLIDPLDEDENACGLKI